MNVLIIESSVMQIPNQYSFTNTRTCLMFQIVANTATKITRNANRALSIYLIFTIPQSPNQANKPNYSSKTKEDVNKKQWKKVPMILPVSDIRRK